MNLKEKLSRRIRQDKQAAGVWAAIAIAGALWLALTGIYPLWPALLMAYALFSVIYLIRDARKGRKILNSPLFYLLAIEHDLQQPDAEGKHMTLR